MRASNLTILGLASWVAITGLARAVSPEELKGSWLGTQENFALKRALVLEHVSKSGSAWSGDARYGSTGFQKLDHLVLAKLASGQEGNPARLVLQWQSFEMTLEARDANRMEGDIVNKQTGRPSRISFVRAPVEALARASINALPVKKKSEILVAFLSTPDCPWCRRWEGDFKAKFLESEGRQVRFETIKGLNLAAGVNAPDWPGELKEVGAQLTGRQPVPSFVVAIDRKVVLNQFGYQFWEPRTLALIREAIAQRGGAPD